MKPSKSSKLRYYYSPELGVIVPAPESHGLWYWVLALIALVIAGGFIFTSITHSKTEATSASPEVVRSSQSDKVEAAQPSPGT